MRRGRRLVPGKNLSGIWGFCEDRVMTSATISAGLREMKRGVIAMLLLSVVAVCSAARRAGPPQPKTPQPTIGDSLEIRAPDSYLGKNTQIVSVITPLSSRQRLIDRKTNEFKGMKRRRGMIHWVKQREAWPFERLKRQPFSIRYLREDPAGVALTLAEEGKLQLFEGETSSGKKVVGFSMKKKKRFGFF